MWGLFCRWASKPHAAGQMCPETDQFATPGTALSGYGVAAPDAAIRRLSPRRRAPHHPLPGSPPFGRTVWAGGPGAPANTAQLRPPASLPSPPLPQPLLMSPSPASFQESRPSSFAFPPPRPPAPHPPPRGWKFFPRKGRWRKVPGHSQPQLRSRCGGRGAEGPSLPQVPRGSPGALETPPHAPQSLAGASGFLTNRGCKQVLLSRIQQDGPVRASFAWLSGRGCRRPSYRRPLWRPLQRTHREPSDSARKTVRFGPGRCGCSGKSLLLFTVSGPGTPPHPWGARPGPGVT